MGEKILRLGAEGQRRAQVLTQLLPGALTVAEAARVLGLSPRQVKRLQAAYRQDGPAVLVHGNQGRTPAHAVSLEVRARVIALARGSMPGSTTSI